MSFLRIEHLALKATGSGSPKPIVNGVSFQIARGEVLGLIGESGAGKSTVGLATLGYIRPGARITGGSIYLDGVNLLASGQKTLRTIRGQKVAYVAQSAAAAFNPAYRIGTQVCETAVFCAAMKRSEARAKAVALYRRLGLPEPEQFGARYPHQVSGGQLQRAMTAMALMCEPDLIVLDEPTTALDVTTQIEVLAIIKEAIRQLGTSALYISHDLAVVAQIADRIIVLRDGSVVEEGATRSILSSPQQQYTTALVNVRHTELSRSIQTHPSEDKLLEVRDVCASYGKFAVLKHVSVALSRSETLALVGESGSGKSTLARVIAGLMPRSSGECRLTGSLLPKSLKKRSIDQLRQIQLIHQMPDVALNPRLRIGETIGRPLTVFFGMRGAERSRRAAELLENVELSRTLLDRFPPELSGGQKQRVCIARALAAEPLVMICDEITSALDPLVAEDILRLLLRLQSVTETACLFITHDISIVRAVADRVAVMHRGEIVEQGITNKVLNPPHHPYTEKLVTSTPEMSVGWLDRVLIERMTTPVA
jgi:peptide/nickel transport system ATP-binding protein